MIRWTALLAVGIWGLVLPGFEFAAEAIPLGPSEAPVCNPGGPYACHTTIQFDARRSYDPDGTIVSYTWDFGDGQTGTGVRVAHQYSSPGIYTVSLVLVDNDNQSSQCETTAENFGPCGDCPPVCDAGGPYQGIVGEPVLLDASGSGSPVPCNPIVYFAWDFGDGVTGVGPQATHTYSAPGFYTITLVVTNDKPYKSACTTTVEIVNPSPVTPATWGRVKHRGGK
jgi:chitodextrinase